MAVNVPEFIHDGVKEAHAGVRCQNQNDRLQDLIAFLLLCLLLLLICVSIALDKEGHRIEDRRIDALAAIDELLALHHFLSNGLDQVFILLLRSEVLLQIFSKILELQVILIIRLAPRWQLNLGESVNFEILRERIDIRNVPWLCAQNNIS